MPSPSPAALAALLTHQPTLCTICPEVAALPPLHTLVRVRVSAVARSAERGALFAPPEHILVTWVRHQPPLCTICAEVAALPPLHTLFRIRLSVHEPVGVALWPQRHGASVSYLCACARCAVRVVRAFVSVFIC